MAGSVFGTIFQISTWGESHGKGVGVTVDGCPAGIPLSELDIQQWLDRRKPGQSKFTTQRKEADQAEILSGVFEGKTTGTPIAVMVRNTDQRSRDYSEIASYYRPGHADYTFDRKYGFRDYRGGGRSSGRETIGRVAGGAVAMQLLKAVGIDLFAYTKEIGGIRIDPEKFSREAILENAVYMPDPDAAAKAGAFLEQCMKEQDSAGGIIECVIRHVPAGLGDPVFEKLDAKLAAAVFSIGAVKGFEVGDGFAAARARGSVNNDSFCKENKNIDSKKDDGEGESIGKKTNHAGGILGGISDGSDIIFRAAVKPTPSISAVQETVNRDGEEISISIKGRHDPVIVPRAVVVVEAMAALTIADALLMGMGSRVDVVKEVYSR